jgi:hypothetical protein
VNKIPLKMGKMKPTKTKPTHTVRRLPAIATFKLLRAQSVATRDRLGR